MKYEEAIMYFEHRAKRTDLPDRCECAEELAIKALKSVQKLEALVADLERKVIFNREAAVEELNKNGKTLNYEYHTGCEIGMGYAISGIKEAENGGA